MFKKLAKLGPLQSWRRVPGLRPIAPANDNRPRASGDAHSRRPRLVCHWFAVDGTGRLGCRWGVEGPDDPDRCAEIHHFTKPSSNRRISRAGTDQLG